MDSVLGNKTAEWLQGFDVRLNVQHWVGLKISSLTFLSPEESVSDPDECKIKFETTDCRCAPGAWSGRLEKFVTLLELSCSCCAFCLCNLVLTCTSLSCNVAYTTCINIARHFLVILSMQLALTRSGQACRFCRHYLYSSARHLFCRFLYSQLLSTVHVTFCLRNPC